MRETGDGGLLPFPSLEDAEFGLQEAYADPEPELVAIVGHDNGVVGYAPSNDVTERLGQAVIIARQMPWAHPRSMGGRYERAWVKSMPGFKPLGSLYRGDIDATDTCIQMIVNGVVVEEGNTRDLIFSIPALLAEARWLLALGRLPVGTCLFSGTPGGIGFQPQNLQHRRPSLKPGDVMTLPLSFGSVTTYVVPKRETKQ